MAARLALCIALFMVIGFFGVLSFYYSVVLVSVETVAMDGSVGPHIAFNADRDALHFGTTPPGSVSERRLTVSNFKDYPVNVKVRLAGNISRFVTVRSSGGSAEPGSNITLAFTFSPPQGALHAGYRGSARVFTRRAFG